MTDSIQQNNQEVPLIPPAEFQELALLVLNNPEEAIPKIQALEQLNKESGSKDNEGIHYFYFLAFGNLAGQKYKLSGNSATNEIIALGEKALSEYRLARQLAQYQEMETYQEEVVVKPAGLFRKAQTELRTKTLTVTKTRLEYKLTEEPLEYISDIMELVALGHVHEILGELGETKLKYMGTERVFTGPSIRDGFNIRGEDIRKDIRSISNVWLRNSRPIRYAGINFTELHGKDHIFVSFFDGRPGDANCTGTYTFVKENGIWEKNN